MSKIRKGRKGFTLVELAVVIVIIGVLASFGVPQFMKSVERSKAAEAFNFLAAVRAAQERYQAREGTYTSTLADLDIQWKKDAGTGEPVLKYFEIADKTASEDSWSATLSRTGSSAGYKYNVIFTKDGYDADNSTIKDYPDINPMSTGAGS